MHRNAILLDALWAVRSHGSLQALVWFKSQKNKSLGLIPSPCISSTTYVTRIHTQMRDKPECALHVKGKKKRVKKRNGMEWRCTAFGCEAKMRVLADTKAGSVSFTVASHPFLDWAVDTR